MTSTVHIRATVLAVGVDPQLRDRLKRYLARVRVDEIVGGGLAETAQGGDLNLLIHSPSMTFRDPDPIGSTFLISLTTPVSDPYAGPIEVSACSVGS